MAVTPIWQNPTLPTDVDRDGQTTPRDALIVLNILEREAVAAAARGEGETPAAGGASSGSASLVGSLWDGFWNGFTEGTTGGMAGDAGGGDAGGGGAGAGGGTGAQGGFDQTLGDLAGGFTEGFLSGVDGTEWFADVDGDDQVTMTDYTDIVTSLLDVNADAMLDINPPWHDPATDDDWWDDFAQWLDENPGALPRPAPTVPAPPVPVPDGDASVSMTIDDGATTPPPADATPAPTPNPTPNPTVDATPQPAGQCTLLPPTAGPPVFTQYMGLNNQMTPGMPAYVWLNDQINEGLLIGQELEGLSMSINGEHYDESSGLVLPLYRDVPFFDNTYYAWFEIVGVRTYKQYELVAGASVANPTTVPVTTVVNATISERTGWSVGGTIGGSGSREVVGNAVVAQGKLGRALNGSVNLAADAEQTTTKGVSTTLTVPPCSVVSLYQVYDVVELQVDYIRYRDDGFGIVNGYTIERGRLTATSRVPLSQQPQQLTPQMLQNMGAGGGPAGGYPLPTPDIQPPR